MKDHQLALLDRNQYPDRGIGVGIGVKLSSGDSSTTKDQDAAAAASGSAHAAKSDKALKQADLSQVNKLFASICSYSAGGAFNHKYAGPPYCRAEMFAGHVAC